ncbi:MAG TPA: oxygen-independent coproporphyrinogen III oxidase [Kofleriaceae bacterium]|nr:oxygen-independent coproporphyrinogen III oxidase [Kofleriaceae bacterium]
MPHARALPMFPARLEEPRDELVSHAQSGPRYTSYPPATQFRTRFAAADAAAELAAMPTAPISLYAHIPFCSQLCWYCGCNVTATRDRSRGTSYVDLLIRELDLVAGALGRRQAVADLSFGGGSPNFLRTEDMGRLVAALRARFDLGADAELGIELDPRDTREAQLDALAALGFTRLSVGIQDFAPEVQEAIHRIQSVEQTAAVIDRARAVGFRSVNADLVYGLPGQTVERLERTLAEVIDFEPDRIAVFGYAHLPHLRPHQQLVERKLPVPDLPARVELLRSVLGRLADAGYVRVGLDHFARPKDPLVKAMESGRLGRNFQGYVIHRSDALLGVGASAISDSGNAYWQNAVDLPTWTEAVEAGRLPVVRGVGLDADDRLRRFVINRLMCEGRLDFADVAAAHGVDVTTRFATELAALERRHGDLAIVDREAGAITATPLGHHLIRNVAKVFDRYTLEGGTGSPTI